MQRSIRNAILSMSFVSISWATPNLMVNSDFESPSLLGLGQSDVPAGGSKLLVQDSALPSYADGILGIPSWINSFTDVGFGADMRDAGISRADFAGTGESRYAFINNWDTRLSQISAVVIEPGYDLFSTISVGMPGSSKAGRLQMWAGEPQADNPDLFPSSAVLIGEVTFGSSDWTEFTPDVVLADGQWTEVSLHLASPSTGPALGQPLTISFLTSSGSQGPLFYDDVTLSAAVPEPGTLVLVPVICAIGWRSRTSCVRHSSAN